MKVYKTDKRPSQGSRNYPIRKVHFSARRHRVAVSDAAQGNANVANIIFPHLLIRSCLEERLLPRCTKGMTAPGC